MGGQGSGRAAPSGDRYVVIHWRGRSGRRQVTKASEGEAVAYGDALLKGHLADGYLVERVTTIVRRDRP